MLRSLLLQLVRVKDANMVAALLQIGVHFCSSAQLLYSCRVPLSFVISWVDFFVNAQHRLLKWPMGDDDGGVTQTTATVFSRCCTSSYDCLHL